MADQSLELDVFRDLLEEAGVVGQLAKDEKAFTAAYEAFRAGNSQQFHAILERLGLLPRCWLVCEWFRSKECIFLCLELCGPPKLTDKPNPRELAEAIVRITSNESGAGKARQGRFSARCHRIQAGPALPSLLSLAVRGPLPPALFLGMQPGEN